MFLDLFNKRKIPKKIPPEMEKIAKSFRKIKSKEKRIRKIYDFLTSRYKMGRIKTYMRIFDLFQPIDKIWSRRSFIHCMNLNYLFTILLVKSGFDEDDINVKWTLVFYLSPHQYLNIKTGKNKSINVDAWGKSYGIKFGDYARGFH